MGDSLIKGVGLFCLVSVPLLLWSWIMGWLPASTRVILVGLLFFSLVALACLHKPREK